MHSLRICGQALLFATLCFVKPVAMSAGYVGSQVCGGCHESAYLGWQGSHHDLAMQPADEETVLGDFGGRVFEHQGVATRFFRRDGGYFVETEGADGQSGVFEVAYTFGVTPLQQYLVRFRDGRFQALTVAWDSRDSTEGGQRWFHLYPNESIPPGDELHWTAPAHTWNFACAECHSTRLRKNYDAASDSYDTDWFEIDVGCESCHGPGAKHATAARLAQEQGTADYPSDHGLVVDLKRTGTWGFVEGSPTAVLSGAGGRSLEPELCGRCHSRRSQVSENYRHGQPLSDTHRLQLLADGMYFPDGQILDEVYVYGSFIQSRMYAAGVTCSDCHDPHSLDLKLAGDGVCLQCHVSSAYATPTHHFHPEASDSARCVACHMPERTYMVVDPRRDHSMRIPQPEHSEALGTPNVCTECHAGRSGQWAVAQLDAWYGKDRNKGFQRFAATLEGARRGSADSGGALERLILDQEAPAIARATALSELRSYLSSSSVAALKAGLEDDDPLVRRAAVEALEPVDLETRWVFAGPLLADPNRGVRIAVGSLLADLEPGRLEDADARKGLENAFDEYIAAEMLNADRVEHWVNIAGFHARRGDVKAAQKAFVEARRRDAGFVPIYANEADMYRSLGREADGERVLREGLGALAESPALHHALGLLLVREKRLPEAIVELGRAFELGADSPRYGYVYGIALNSIGETGSAIGVWEQVLENTPDDLQTLYALAPALRDSGDRARAISLAKRLTELAPQDPQVQPLRQSLQLPPME